MMMYECLLEWKRTPTFIAKDYAQSRGIVVGWVGSYFGLLLH